MKIRKNNKNRIFLAKKDSKLSIERAEAEGDFWRKLEESRAGERNRISNGLFF